MSGTKPMTFLIGDMSLLADYLSSACYRAGEMFSLMLGHFVKFLVDID